ncbi:MAG TPA: Ni/Fe-hydrogenase, b-type cytochrome subunit [Nitrospirota bacterium]|nr:Ni/Fe-hydrogenase, b-type cytochrome subunit [Nitrospirota bacterium]
MQPQRIRVCVWERPVRFTHWINVLCIIALSITGYYIGKPFIHAYSTKQYIMGWMRFIHFVAAYVMLMSIIIRIYWAFAGNKYASWKAFFPFNKKGLTQMMESLRFYLLLSRRHSHMLGHSALAGSTYLAVFLLFAAEVLTGFALYSQSHYSVIMQLLGGWLLNIVSVQTVRLYHHLIMWALIIFSMLHIYVAWFVDATERNGLMGSIFGGYKFVTKGREL